MRSARAIVTGAWILFTMLSSSCSEETIAPYRAPEHFGVLEGYALVTGRPVEIAIGARLFEYPGTIIATTRSNAAGWYRLELVPDTYRIEVDPDVGSGYRSSDVRDTVRVAAGRRRLDLRWGTLTIRVATPPQLEGRFLSCHLDPSNVRLLSASARARDGQFEFVFPVVEAGIYQVRLGDQLWLPGTYDFASATRVPVPVTHPVVHEASLNGYASISGSIRGSWQQANFGSPQVTAFTLDMQQIASTSVAADGSYTLDLLLARPVKIRVRLNDIEQWIGGDSFETATVFLPTPGEHPRDVSLVESGILCRLEGPGFLTNRRARIRLRDSRGRTYEPSVYGSTLIPLCNLPPESYTLFVYGYCDYDGGEPWASQWYDGADSLGAATIIHLAPGELVPITVHLEMGAALEGRVLTADGEPAFIGVMVVDGHDVPLCGDDFQHARGQFSFRGLNNGDYKLAAAISSEVLWWYPGTAHSDSARVIEIRDRMSVTGIEWRLPPPSAKARP